MPWKIIDTIDQKIQLIADWQKQNFSLTDLSQKYGISRPTVYKFIGRYEQFGIEGFKEQAARRKHALIERRKILLILLFKKSLKTVTAAL